MVRFFQLRRIRLRAGGKEWTIQEDILSLQATILVNAEQPHTASSVHLAYLDCARQSNH